MDNERGSLKLNLHVRILIRSFVRSFIHFINKTYMRKINVYNYKYKLITKYHHLH